MTTTIERAEKSRAITTREARGEAREVAGLERGRRPDPDECVQWRGIWVILQG